MLSPPNGITPLIFSEFGTRRRRSFHVQDLVMRGLVEGYEEHKVRGAKGGVLAGTSNVSVLLSSQILKLGF
jgi:nicotinate phosphoribosyltransferase